MQLLGRGSGAAGAKVGELESRKFEQRWEKIWTLRAKTGAIWGEVRVNGGSRGESGVVARASMDQNMPRRVLPVGGTTCSAPNTLHDCWTISILINY
jgi:hypothetical protein